jgi:hypothetical protein
MRVETCARWHILAHSSAWIEASTLCYSPRTRRRAPAFARSTLTSRTFQSNRYVSLKHREDPAYELAIISHDHAAIPEGFRRSTSALLLNFEVPSVEGE